MMGRKGKILFLFLFVGALLSIVYLWFYINELENQIIERDNLISKAKVSDSKTNKQTKQYADTIAKYISDCSFSIGDRKISTAELLKITNESLEKNSVLEDSLSYLIEHTSNQKEHIEYLEGLIRSYYDSARINKHIIELIRDEYGISYKSEKKGEKYYFIKERNRVDSALVLYPHYKDKLSIDTIKNNWIIITEPKKSGEINTNKRKKSRRK